MIPQLAGRQLLLIRIPRESGDDPDKIMSIGVDNGYSPRERG